MNLAPLSLIALQSTAGQRLAPPLNAVLAGLPLTIAKELDPGAVHKQVQRPIGAAIWDLDGQRSMGLHGPTGAMVPSHSVGGTA